MNILYNAVALSASSLPLLCKPGLITYQAEEGRQKLQGIVGAKVGTATWITFPTSSED
ncbi:uncharacterized protein MYCFIDRAFT_177083 [Pseudocercospora fijiensis CIRAD86]|uniref:Uncharacterized protein n=1 Tax=Pseudocercospora fijiensis (strain CIRAD86) TaxID=383855 RepID=M3A668_PSEFD|nr:uncharacterized protein MYCFIDRAFT_177083 [Pseudocercospora fijiensis CIRAD86]EME80106.1 hypothetical protein MYCFIDRAFT_177083 [Pseudocercospora fijiensis CIRAD86]